MQFLCQLRTGKANKKKGLVSQAQNAPPFHLCQFCDRQGSFPMFFTWLHLAGNCNRILSKSECLRLKSLDWKPSYWFYPSQRHHDQIDHLNNFCWTGANKGGWGKGSLMARGRSRRDRPFREAKRMKSSVSGTTYNIIKVSSANNPFAVAVRTKTFQELVHCCPVGEGNRISSLF